MEGKKTKPRALLVFGAPCSGKTTFAEKFANKFDLTYYDLEEAKKQTDFTDEQLRAALGLVAHTKKTVILEGGMDTEEDRRLLRNVFINAGYTSALIWIQTDVSTIKTRMKFRHKSMAKAKDAYEEFIKTAEAPTDLEKPIILSGKHTFETQTRHVVAGLADGRKR